MPFEVYWYLNESFIILALTSFKDVSRLCTEQSDTASEKRDKGQHFIPCAIFHLIDLVAG